MSNLIIRIKRIMNPSKRLFVNTIVQYLRTLINALLSLYSARLVLDVLGVSDYGIYNLVGGLVSMLSFVGSALSSTTQRYLSYNQQNKSRLYSIFSNCVIIHLFLSIVVCCILASLTPIFFNGFLNISSDRINAAKTVYVIVISMLFLTFMIAPFRAVLIARENIVYVSIIDVLDGVLKVVLVTILAHLSYDKLISYALIMLTIQLFNFIALSTYDFIKYDECRLPRIRFFTIQFFKEVFSFAGWTLYGVACLTGRTQGVAILLNKSLGTSINTAYGMGAQINSMLIFVCESLKNAIKPQTIKAEAEGNRTKMIKLVETESKFSYFLLACLSIPAIFEMPKLLELWLKEVPDHTILFARMFLLVSLFDTFTTGLGTANQAVGKVKLYNLLVFTVKLTTLPIVYLEIRLNCSLLIVALTFIIIEMVSSLTRIFVLKHQIDLQVWRYLRNVIIPTILPTLICVSSCIMVFSLCTTNYRFILTFILAFIFYIPAVYYCGINSNEKSIILNVLHKKNK